MPRDGFNLLGRDVKWCPGCKGSGRDVECCAADGSDLPEFPVASEIAGFREVICDLCNGSGVAS